LPKRPEVRSGKSRIYEPRVGYDLAASAYETWPWFQFWRHNEMPIVQQWAAALSPGTLLDAGSGTGLYRSALERMGHQVIGVDLSRAMLKIQLKKKPTASVVQATVEALPFKACSFDSLLCTRVLSHLPELKPVFHQFIHVTKPGAALLIADVHPEHRYSEMSIPINHDRISIQTFKHPVQEIKKAIEASGLMLVTFHEVYLRDLRWKPPTEGFANIYDEPERPIFYTCSLRRP
jgi:ubiquinone/menaquinone biosynthesis C-methylase UbiE